jgi:hypothetical protein
MSPLTPSLCFPVTAPRAKVCSCCSLLLVARSARNGSGICRNLVEAEDDADEMHRRLDDVRKFYNARMAELGDIRLVDLVGEDSILGRLMRGKIEPAPMYHELDAFLSDFRPGLTGLDVLADMFEGDENNRAHSANSSGY